MNAVVGFMRSFPQTRETLCSEAVVAWLKVRGATTGISRRSQIVTHAKYGADGGASLVADQIGAREIKPADALDGDVALVPCANGNRVLGIHIGQGVTVMAGFGEVHIGHFEIDRAWRLQA